jgi:hypothetical protein
MILILSDKYEAPQDMALNIKAPLLKNLKRNVHLNYSMIYPVAIRR